VSPEYRAYLLSPAWKKKSEARKKKDGYKCVICGSTKKLNVHHKTYKRVKTVKGKIVATERMSDLVTLCSECHRKVHRRYTRLERIQLFAYKAIFFVVLTITIILIIGR